MRIVYFLLFFIFSLVNATEFSYKIVGNLTRNEITNFPGGGKFIAFKHSGGFETQMGKYGKYQCNGNILYNEQSTLENMYFACEHIDQNGDIFIAMGKRLKGSDMDIALGETVLVDGKGFWLDFVGYKCTYAVEYVSDIVFSPVKCKK